MGWSYGIGFLRALHHTSLARPPGADGPADAFYDRVPLSFQGDARDYSSNKHNDAVWSLESMKAIAGKLSSQADSPANAIGAFIGVI
ncbi:hypothetical protein [Aidingimonas lacisalsi]|uniref:hypothetical protein n=1 Tax=Aidingimonas lacisalsi TaxID=2604086 RepID=UPI0011D22E54|nr:hypothetical protein [Aidingimonas lacisalsi]